MENLPLFFFGVLLFLVSMFLMALILVQRGKGGGLTGALGGMGGASAFGSKASDAFTKITVITSVVWIGLCMLTIALFNRPPEPPERETMNDAADIYATSSSGELGAVADPGAAKIPPNGGVPLGEAGAGTDFLQTNEEGPSIGGDNEEGPSIGGDNEDNEEGPSIGGDNEDNEEGPSIGGDDDSVAPGDVDAEAGSMKAEDDAAAPGEAGSLSTEAETPAAETPAAETPEKETPATETTETPEVEKPKGEGEGQGQ